jgi:hypothetical protein
MIFPADKRLAPAPERLRRRRSRFFAGKPAAPLDTTIFRPTNPLRRSRNGFVG